MLLLLVQVLQMLGFCVVLVQPGQTFVAPGHYIELEVGAVFWHLGLRGWLQSLRPRAFWHLFFVLISVGETQALVKVSLIVKDFTHKHSVKAKANSTSREDQAGVGVTAFKLQMFEVLVHELTLDWLKQLIKSF